MARRIVHPPASCNACPIRLFTLYWQGDGEAGEAVRRLRKGVKEVRAKRFLMREGEPMDEVYSIFSGWGARMKAIGDGRRKILHFMMPSDFVDFPLLSARTTSYSVMAMSDMQVCVFDREALAEFVSARPALLRRLERWISMEMMYAYDHLLNVGRRTAMERIARLLLELYRRQERLGLLEADGVMRCPLRQQDIGDALGLTSVHVSRTLAELKADGFLELHASELRILDRAGLRSLVGLPVDSATPEFEGFDTLEEHALMVRPLPGNAD